MKDIEKLRHLLNWPPVPDKLAAQIRANLKQQLGKTSMSPRSRRWALGVSIAAGLLIAVVLSLGYLQTPDIIKAAYTDISKDRSLHNGLVRQQRIWLERHAIHAPPAQMNVEMSKYCYLAGNKTVHLRLANRAQGIVHLFFYAGNLITRRWGRTQGRNDGMYFKVVRAWPQLTVLVLYTRNIPTQAVEDLLSVMLQPKRSQTPEQVITGNTEQHMV